MGGANKMTKEQAYEKLELPVGSDLQLVRQKFQQMHNDFQVQIDGAFNLELKQRKEQQLEELKEAYTILNDSENMDDSASLPRTERMFEYTGSNANATNDTMLPLEQVLSLFGINRNDTISEADNKVDMHLSSLQDIYHAIHIPTAKEAYRQEIDKAEKAKLVVAEWLIERKQQESLAKPQPQKQPQASVSSSATPTIAPSSSIWAKTNMLLYIIPIVLIIGLVIYFAIQNAGNSTTDKSTQLHLSAAKDSSSWKSALAGNNASSYHHYLTVFPEGIFIKAAHDSLAQINKNVLDAKQIVKQPENDENTQRIIEQQNRIKPLEQQAEVSSLNKSNVEYQSQKTENTEWKNKYDYISSYQEGLATVKLNGKWGFVDATGKVIIPIKYDNTDMFHQGITKVKLNKKWGYIDKTDNLIIPFKYDSVRLFNDDIAAVRLNGKWGYIDKTDNLIIPFKYDEAKLFYEGLAPVKLNGKWGYIDKIDRIIIPFKYGYAGWFKEGRAHVKLNGKEFYINRQDEWVKDY